jgi:predicted O-methyltransferase YrrM
MAKRKTAVKKVVEELDLLTIFEESFNQENIDYARALLSQMEDDPHIPAILELFEKDVTNIWLVLPYLARKLAVKRYLEIGVRRGFSMALVGGVVPKATLYGFDMWIKGYGKAENPGPELVLSEVAKSGHHGEIVFVEGDTASTLPNFKPPAPFELILIDGNHTETAVYHDAVHCLKHLAPGGVLVLDDLQDSEVYRAWERVTSEAGLSCVNRDRVGLIHKR